MIALGVGVNLNTRAFPAELAPIAVSVFQLTGRETPLPDFAFRLTAELREAIEQSREGAAALLEKYRARCVSVGRELVIRRGGAENEENAKNARALGVNEDFSLAVVWEDGRREDLRCGEVSLRTLPPEL